MSKVGCFFTVLLSAALSHAAESSSLNQALVFHASFDRGVNADRAQGDKTLYWMPKMAFPPDAKPGLPPKDLVVHESTGGLNGGGCLRFTKKAAETVFYRVPGNMPYAKSNLNGTVSFWLRLTPDEDLEPGFTDPIQITSKSWDDAAFFVEFSKDEKPREFRLGVYADKKVWNPAGKDWNSIPMSEKPLLPVIKPPFTRDQWTHVAFTFQNFNTGKPDGVSRLFLNGQDKGALAPREQTFSWDLDKALIMLGLSYVGRFDELAIFNRALTPAEIAQIHQSKGLPRAQ